jgi:tetratricopeptide (TPR) repeat protein
VRSRCAGAVVLLVAAGPAFGAQPAKTTATPPTIAPRNADADAAIYDRCLKLAATDPAAARKLAQDWRQRNGAHPADHCLAVALIGLKQYKEAADRLETLAQDMIAGPAALRADVLGQAAQAWLLAGEPGRAYAADEAALALRPDDAELLLDRAEAAGAAGWYDKALADLDRVLRVDPSRVDALVYRASASRAQGKLDPALADVETALRLAPDSAPALLERGNIRAVRGEADGAKQDWERVAALAPGSAAASAAKANLARLAGKDVSPVRPRPNPPPPAGEGRVGVSKPSATR